MNILMNNNEVISERMIQSMEYATLLLLKNEDIDENNVEISVSLVSSDEIKQLNFEYRNKNEVTDVLSFPQYETFDFNVDEPLIVLGDVVICNDKIKMQAEENGHTYEREFIYLYIHSVLHLLGYDHMDEMSKANMRDIEIKVMNKIIV